MADDTVAGSPAIPQPTDKEVDKARKDGAIDKIKEQAGDSYEFLTDGNLPGDGSGDRWPGRSEIMQYVDLLDLDLDEFKDRIDAKKGLVAEDKVAGLLGVEKSGRNRSTYVEAMVKRLGVKSVREVTHAGPNWTNVIADGTSDKYHDAA